METIIDLRVDTPEKNYCFEYLVRKNVPLLVTDYNTAEPLLKGVRVFKDGLTWKVNGKKVSAAWAKFILVRGVAR